MEFIFSALSFDEQFSNHISLINFVCIFIVSSLQRIGRKNSTRRIQIIKEEWRQIARDKWHTIFP